MIEFHTDQNIKVDPEKIARQIAEIQQDPMGGWFDLPENYDRDELTAIKDAAAKIKSDSKFLVCIGIGGSYLGHKALIEALQPYSSTKILYAGNSLSSRELRQVMTTIGDASFSINVISKSGTTTEPAVAFRILKQKLIDKYGDKAASRIYATTDSSKGALHDEAISEGYTRFVVPDNIGGRYSVLSAVGLLPLAVAGVDIDALLTGAADERQGIISSNDYAASPVACYATMRAKLAKHYNVEVLATFEPCLHDFAEWWKQLFGESEGKKRKGIFPASVVYTTDLHSLGQYLQEGKRNIFETMLVFSDDKSPEILVNESSNDLDDLQYLENRTLSYLNQTACAATIAAHRAGGIPVSEIIAPDLSAHSLGGLVFFFETACALSAKLQKLNPFDQPGVEAYKTNMFRLLGKPGFTD